MMIRKLFTLLFTAMLLISASGYAKSGNNIESGSHFGFDAGYSHNWLQPMTSLDIYSGSSVINTTKKTSLNLDGFYIGPTYTYCFKSVTGLYLSGSIMYQYATGKVEKDQVAALTCDILKIQDETEELEKCNKLSYTMHNLEVPIRVGYNYVFSSGLGFQVYAGPVFNFALDWYMKGETDELTAELHQLSGKIVVKKGENKTTYNEDSSSRRLYNVFDISIGGGIGFTYKIVYLNLGCDWGLTNLCRRASYAGVVEGASYAYTNSAKQVKLKLGIGLRF